MTKSRKILLIIDLIFLGLTLIFIWGNSCLPIDESASVSSGALGFLQGIFDFIFGEGVITHDVFRKLTHGAEFFILGTEICVLFIILKRFSLKNLAFILSVGLFVSVIDEAIQILSIRGPAIIDVLIDFGGVFTATLIFYFITSLIFFIKGKKN